jgi:hypothetical protein
VAAWWIDLRGCGVPARRRLEVPLCLAVEAGALEGRGTGATQAQQHARRPWVALLAGPAVSFVPTPRLALMAGVDLVVPLWRAVFLIGDERVHRPLPAGVRVSAGIEVRFGVAP